MHQSFLGPACEPVLRYLLPLCYRCPRMRDSFRAFWRDMLECLLEEGEPVPEETVAAARRKLRAAESERELEDLYMDDDDVLQLYSHATERVRQASEAIMLLLTRDADERRAVSPARGHVAKRGGRRSARSDLKPRPVSR